MAPAGGLNQLVGKRAYRSNAAGSCSLETHRSAMAADCTGPVVRAQRLDNIARLVDRARVSACRSPGATHTPVILACCTPGLA
jgi:hypothetical protein